MQLSIVPCFKPFGIDVLTRPSMLSCIAAQCKYDEAESLFRDSLDILKQTMGPNHPLIGTILNNLANVLRSQVLVDKVYL